MKKCRYCDKPFEEHCLENRLDANYWIEEEEGKKMKCPKCDLEMRENGGYWQCPDIRCPRVKIPDQPNPSPRDIFQHIKTDCERKAFDEFMLEYRFHVWDGQFTDETLNLFKKNHPDWYSWLQSKGLVHKEKVKREAWGVVRTKNGIVNVSEISWKHPDIIESENKWGVAVKVIKLYEWEE